MALSFARPVLVPEDRGLGFRPVAGVNRFLARTETKGGESVGHTPGLTNESGLFRNYLNDFAKSDHGGIVELIDNQAHGIGSVRSSDVQLEAPRWN